MKATAVILFATRAKAGALLVTLLCLFWLAVSFQRSVLLLGDPAPAAQVLGITYLLP